MISTVGNERGEGILPSFWILCFWVPSFCEFKIKNEVLELFFLPVGSCSLAKPLRYSL